MKIGKKNAEVRDYPDKKKSILPGAMAAALVTAVILYVVMLNVEKNALSNYEKGTVYFAATAVPEGQLITEENFKDYFAAKEIDKTLIPAAAVTEEQIYGLLPVADIDAGAMLTMGMFEKIEDVVADMEQPVIASFRGEDLYQVTGGVLRAGDYIHIYKVEETEEAKETTLIWENVFIQQVFDGSGVPIGNEDKTTSAQRINVYMDKCNVERFYTELASGSLRVVKDVRR